MRRNSLAVVIATFLVLGGQGTALAGARAEQVRASERSKDWVAALVTPRRSLPFDPMALPAPPPPALNQLNDQRWWATVIAQGVIALRLVDGAKSGRMTDATEALLEKRELNWDVGAVRPPNMRLRLQFGERRGGPNAAVILLW